MRPDLPKIRPDGELEDLRVLVRHRRELRAGRNWMANRLRADVEQLHAGYQQRIGRLTTERIWAAGCWPATIGFVLGLPGSGGEASTTDQAAQ